MENVTATDLSRASVKIYIKPMILWLWIGGGMMAIGTILAAFPGRRRRPTAAVSAPAPMESDRERLPDAEPARAEVVDV